MKIHKYNDEYAGKNGVNGIKETIIATLIGVFGGILPAILGSMAMEKYNHSLVTIIVIVAYIIVVLLMAYVLKRMCACVKAFRSVIIEDENDLYYMTINPNLIGTSLPKSFSDFLAGRTAIYAENKIDAEVKASNYAQNDTIIDALFDLYKNDKIKSTFESFMYGKPVYVSKLLDTNFKSKYKQIYKVKCIKDKSKNCTAKIPNSFPTFFNQ